MKLGEALSLRARQAQQLDDLRSRIKANVLVQEGSEPAEDAKELIEEYEQLSDRHSELVMRIVRTNTEVQVNGDTLLTLLHLREALRRKRNIHDLAAQSATPGRDAFRYMRSEIKYLPTIEVVEHRKIADELDNQIRSLDAKIQATNWQVDLLE